MMATLGPLRRCFRRITQYHSHNSLLKFLRAHSTSFPECGNNDKLKEGSCWKCGAKSNSCCSFFCCKCHSIQPIAKRSECSYFHLFNVPQKFDIEPKEIEKIFWSLQKKMHPDVYGNHSKTEQQISAENSAMINEAYRILKEPNLRANYLLKLHGLNAVSEENNVSIDQELLMEVMETREAIENCINEQELEQLKCANCQDIQSCMSDIKEAYDNNGHDLSKVKNLTIRLQYQMKIAMEIREKEDIFEAST